MGWGLALGVGASLLGSLSSKTPEAEVSEAELAQAELMTAMRDSYKKTGIPLQRERLRETLGMKYDPDSKTYSHDPTARRSNLDADGNMRFQGVQSGEAAAGVSQAYESQRPTFNPNAASRDMGDIDQAADEAAATRQAAEADTSNAFGAMSNAAGMAHGAQMQSSQDIGQLAADQSTAANFNAANRFAQQTNNRGMVGEAAGAGMAFLNRQTSQSPAERLGSRRLHSGGR